MGEPLDTFGKLVMEKLRDRALERADQALAGKGKAPAVKQLQADLARLDDAGRAAARRLVRDSIDAAIHDFLFALVEANDFGGSVQVLADGENLAARSDGLQGEPAGERGWQARFSRFGRAPDQA
jgi:hypothetical protein